MNRIKFLLLTIVFLFSVISCAGLPKKYSVDGKITLENNTFEYSYEDDTTTNTAKISVVHNKKSYACEVVYEKGAHSPFGIAFDASTVELTGSIKVIYKKVMAECKVRNE